MARYVDTSTLKRVFNFFSMNNVDHFDSISYDTRTYMRIIH